MTAQAVADSVSPSRLSLVIPVFRNKGAVSKTFEQASAVLLALQPRLEIEFVFVDDGSDDGSLEELLQLRSDAVEVRVLVLSRNFGQAAAIAAGLDACSGAAAVIMSADLQDPPELLADMVQAWRAGSEVVIGYRAARQDALSASLTSRIFYSIIRRSLPNMPLGGFDFVLLERKALESFRNLREKNPFFQGNILWIGYKTHLIPYTRRKREIGRSQYNFAKRLKYFIDGILASSYLAVRLMSLAGVACALAGFVWAVFIALGRALGFAPFIGWAPLMITILIVGGIIMVMLGILGEYIWRIYDEVRARPRFIVRENIKLP